MIDVSGLIPEAQPVATEVATIYLRHTSPWFIGLIAHGSAVKGDFIPGCSDIDFHLYLEQPAFSAGGHLPLELGFSIRRDLEDIDLGPFRYAQCYAKTDAPQEELVGPIPGAYHLLSGRLPVPEATASQLHSSAVKALNELDPAPAFIMGKLLGHGGVRLARSLRYLCTKVWPVLYQILTIQSDDPIEVWGLPKKAAMARLPEGSDLAETIQRYYQAVVAYYPAESSLEGAFAMIEHGIGFLNDAKSWWESEHVHH